MRGALIFDDGVMARVQQLDKHELHQLMELAQRDLGVGGHTDLASVVSAHMSNTFEQMHEALKGRYHMLEGDVRIGDGNELVMSHSRNGEGLSTRQWLQIVKSSGRIAKLDFKNLDALEETVALVHELGIDAQRVMINAPAVNWPTMDRLDEQRVQQLAAQLPGAMLSLGINRIPYSQDSIRRAQHLARRWPSDRVSFPLQSDMIEPDVVRQLLPYGYVSAWNSPVLHDPPDHALERQRLREMGVNGMIDLRARGRDMGAPAQMPPTLDALQPGERARPQQDPSGPKPEIGR